MQWCGSQLSKGPWWNNTDSGCNNAVCIYDNPAYGRNDIASGWYNAVSGCNFLINMNALMDVPWF